MSKKVLVIPGHGAGDSGAVVGALCEADIVRKLATEMKAWGGGKVRRTAYGRNYYEDWGVSHIDMHKYPPSEWLIVELHMDASETGGKAHGAHTVTYRSTTPTSRRIAKKLAKLLPGRAEIAQVDDDLRNPRIGSVRGYDYTLVEVGFIDNEHDRGYVTSHMAKVAKAILRGCGITPRVRRRKDVKCPW